MTWHIIDISSIAIGKGLASPQYKLPNPLRKWCNSNIAPDDWFYSINAPYNLHIYKNEATLTALKLTFGL